MSRSVTRTKPVRMPDILMQEFAKVDKELDLAEASFLDVESHQCFVCLGVPNVPVSMTCTQCNSFCLDDLPNLPFIRLFGKVVVSRRIVCCMSCMHALLQLDRPAAQRAPSRRHPICQREFPLQRLGPEPYQIEYDIIASADRRGLRPQPCDRCESNFASRRALLEHQLGCLTRG